MGDEREIKRYRGCYLYVDPEGSPSIHITAAGFRFSINPVLPHNSKISRRDQLINKAKKFVDEMLDPPSHTKKAS